VLSAETDSSEGIRKRVIAVRERQLHRFRSEKIFSYSSMTADDWQLLP
jgi:predicted ATPase with chaperone activity